MALFEAVDIHKRFGARVVLENVTLRVEAGTVHGIMGPNGAGKTTCFNVLTGHHAPDGGRIVFDGRDITGMRPHRIARLGIARSFQIMNLFDDTVVIENVILALPQFRARALNAVRDVFADRALVAEALGVLDEVDLIGKELLLEGLVAAISHDGRMSVAEAVLLRVVCASLHCPLPPMLEQRG